MTRACHPSEAKEPQHNLIAVEMPAWWTGDEAACPQALENAPRFPHPHSLGGSLPAANMLNNVRVGVGSWLWSLFRVAVATLLVVVGVLRWPAL